MSNKQTPPKVEEAMENFNEKGTGDTIMSKSSDEKLHATSASIKVFGIGGGELIFIIFIALMLFGSDKIPDIARAMGKGMAQLKNATNEIKSEIQKGAEANGLDKTLTEMTDSFTKEIDEVKAGIDQNITTTVQNNAQDIEEITGPIKRQM